MSLVEGSVCWESVCQVEQGLPGRVGRGVCLETNLFSEHPNRVTQLFERPLRSSGPLVFCPSLDFGAIRACATAYILARLPGYSFLSRLHLMSSLASTNSYFVRGCLLKLGRHEPVGHICTRQQLSLLWSTCRQHLPYALPGQSHKSGATRTLHLLVRLQAEFSLDFAIASGP